MRSTLMTLLVGAVLAATACAGARKNTPVQEGSAAVSAPKQKVRCTWEKPIGSNISRKVCRSVEQIERERQSSQEAIERIRPQGSGGLE
ncbi:MAG: hypothetical protein AAB426_13495 [Myxococcota bacterium]